MKRGSNPCYLVQPERQVSWLMDKLERIVHLLVEALDFSVAVVERTSSTPIDDEEVVGS